MSNVITPDATTTSTQAEVSVVTADFTLTSQDRCDLCAAQAYFQVEFSHGSLLFCSHHYRASESKLVTQALRIKDESARLS
jgi:hypothetical protein